MLVNPDDLDTRVLGQIQARSHMGIPTGESWPGHIGQYNNKKKNSKRPLTPKSMPPAGDEHAKLKT